MGSRKQGSQDEPAPRKVSKSEKRLQNKAAWRQRRLVKTADPDEPPPAQLPGLAYYAELANIEEFFRDCLLIVTKSGHLAPLVLNSTQRFVLAKIRYLISRGIPPRLAILKSRQVGVSTLIEALLFWDDVVRPNRSSLVLAHTLKSSKTLFRMSRNFHRLLPKAMQQETRIQNVHEIEFDSGSRLQVEVQGEARSYTAQMVHLSEFAFYEQAAQTLIAVSQTVPNSVDSLIAIESTANGMGGIGEKFHKLWQRAVGVASDSDIPEDEKGWTPIFIPWFRHEEYEMPHDGNMFLSAVEAKLMRDHLEKLFPRDVCHRKLKWRRWCISANCDGDEEKFAQEYPTTWQEAFLLSGRPAFDTESVQFYTHKLNELIQSKQLPARCEIENDQPGYGVPNIVVHERGRLRIFFEPQDRHTYIVGADPSEGDPGSDPSPLAVLDNQTMDLAAVWYGKAPPDVLACHAVDLANHYRQALLIHEANNHGILFTDTVLQIGYPHFYFRRVNVESVAGEITEKPGFLQTDRNRQYLFDTLRKYVRMRMGKLHSPEIIQQIQTAVFIDEKVQAGPRSEKDLLIAFGLCLMAHRGSINNPLEPHPLEFMREVGTTAQMIKERQGPEEAAQFIRVRTGMSLDEYLKVRDAVDEHEAREKKYGIAGMR